MTYFVALETDEMFTRQVLIFNSVQYFHRREVPLRDVVRTLQDRRVSLY